MDELRRPARRGTIPWGFIGMIALVAVTERFVAHHPVAYSGKQSNSWRFSAEAAGRCPRSLDVLCLGDSQVKVGVLPRVLETRLGGRAFNAAAFGGQAPTVYFLLRRVLESGARPRAVVVDFDPNLLAVSPKSNAACWGDLVAPRDAFELAWDARDFALVKEAGLAALLPSYKGRAEIRARIHAALAGRGDPGLEEREAMVRNWQANLGAHVAARGNQTSQWAVDTNVGRAKAWKPHRVNAAYLDRFLDLARKEGTTVYWLLPPKSTEWRLRRERLGSDVTFAALVRARQARYPNLVVVDGQHTAYSADCFLDHTHLNRRGAAALSEALADVIATQREAGRTRPRWVVLPDSRGRYDVRDAEDLSESLAATRSGRSVR